MYKFLVVACLVALVLVAGCTPLAGIGGQVGSGRPASQDFRLTGFDAVDIDSAFTVHLVRGDSYKVAVTMDDNLLKYARVTLEGRTLHIRAEENGIAWFSPRIQEAAVTMPELHGVKLNGASQASMAGFGPVEQFAATLDGAGRLSGEVQATDVVVNADGSSRCDLTGQAATLKLTGNGVSRLELSGLAVQKASVHLDGASNASINAGAGLDYDLNGLARLSYAGTPTIGLARAEGPAAIWTR